MQTIATYNTRRQQDVRRPFQPRKPTFRDKFQTLVRSKKFKKVSLIALVVVLVIVIISQLTYPSNKTLPVARIDGYEIGGITKNDAIKKANDAYKKYNVTVEMQHAKKTSTKFSLGSIDATIDNTSRINKQSYPWYVRLIPTSLFWYGSNFGSTPKPTFSSSTDDKISQLVVSKCQIKAVNASLKADGPDLKVISATTGGQCDETKIRQAIKAISPKLDTSTKISVNMTDINPDVDDNAAKKVADTLKNHLSSGIKVKAESKTYDIPREALYSWLDFSVKDKKLIASVNSAKATKWLDENIGKHVNVAAGTTKITTKDFTVVSKQVGATGKSVDNAATIQSIQKAVDGESTDVSATIKSVAPKEEYSRSYSASDEGLSALMSNYAKDHTGTYGVSMIELDGKKRRAEYNGDKSFITASTYKLFVAYSVLKRIDAGTRSWSSDQTCFNKMISLSDNDCARNFLHAIGPETITREINAIGLKNSTFMKSDGIHSTPNDQAEILGMIATGQNCSSVNQQRLISAMKANVYRKGIPAGVSGTVADKVGFLDGLLHDSAIVYGSHGTYVLSIMTDGSSWANIAELAKQIDALHAQ